MERAATIHVRVTDGEGRPVPGARAHLNPNVIWGGRYSEIFGTGRATEEFLRMAAEERQKHFAGRGWAPKFFALTDEKGIATIRNIPVGKQHLIVFGKGAETQPWPSGARRLDRNEIELSAGEAREVRVMLREASGGRE
jgi:hypothetical protein